MKTDSKNLRISYDFPTGVPSKFFFENNKLKKITNVNLEKRTSRLNETNVELQKGMSNLTKKKPNVELE